MTLQFNYMAVDPSSNQNLWGATAGSLYRSTDGGNTFRPVPIALDAGLPRIFGLALNPQSGSTLFVIAQYTPNIGLLWKSTDSGQTWANVDPPGAPSTLTGFAPVSFHFNHGAPQTVYYQINNRLYKSTDQAVTWTLQQASLPGSFVEVNAADAKHMYCLLSASALTGSGLAVSTDEGVTWKGTSVPKPSLVADQIVKSIQGGLVYSDPTNPNAILYLAAITFGESVGQTSGNFLFYSTDGGQSFHTPNGAVTNTLGDYYPSSDGTLILNQSLPPQAVVNRSGDFGQSWSANSQSVFAPFAFEPQNSKTVYGSGFQQISGDGGITWQARSPKYYPAPLPIYFPITLEAGTAYVSPGGALSDTEGNNLILSNPAVTSNATWLTATVQYFAGSETYYSYKVSAAGLKPGNYKGEIHVTSPEISQDWIIAVALTVVDFVPPQLRFDAKLIAGTGVSSAAGDNGPANKASIECCDVALAFDPQGNLYLDSLHRVRKISSGTMTTYAGTGAAGNTGDGGPAAAATFDALTGLAYTSGGLVMEDALDNVLRIIGPDGRISTLYNGPFSVTPSVSFLSAIAADTQGNLLLTDGFGIYQWSGKAFTSLYSQDVTLPLLRYLGVTPQNKILATNGAQVIRINGGNSSPTPLAGTATSGFSGDHGPALSAAIAPSTQLVMDSKGNLYFGDGTRVRAVLTSGNIETIAGDGDTVNPLADGSPAIGGSLGVVTALAIDSNDNLFVSSRNNYIYELQLQKGPPAPQINSGGVASLASGAKRVSPGEMISIYGSNLSTVKDESPSIPLSEDLDGVVVKANGKPIPIYFISDIQINAQIPWEIADGNTGITVTSAGGASNTVQIAVVEAAPDFLQYNGHQAVAVMPNGSLNGPDNPAAADTYLVVYLTGIGPVDQPVTTGGASPSSPAANAKDSFEVTLDKAKLTASFLGMTPGSVGLAQLNIQVPKGLKPGQHSLQLTIAGAASNVVSISTK